MNYKKEHHPILSWKEDDRPREKLFRQGARALANTELLAIILRSGMQGESAVEMARRMLLKCDEDLSNLGRMSPEALCQLKGVGQAKAGQVIAALELGRRRQEHIALDRATIRSSKDVYEIFRPMLMDHQHEEFWVLTLNRANRVMGKSMISRGGLSGTVADPKMIFNHALMSKCSAIILVHNHPSGNAQPSQSDRDITRKLKNAGDFLDLPVLDHLIITEQTYYSFADEGIL